MLQAKSAWSMKIRRDPCRHCRYARVYGHTTTVVRDVKHTHPTRLRPCVRMSTPPPPHPTPRHTAPSTPCETRPPHLRQLFQLLHGQPMRHGRRRRGRPRRPGSRQGRRQRGRQRWRSRRRSLPALGGRRRTTASRPAPVAATAARARRRGRHHVTPPPHSSSSASFSVSRSQPTQTCAPARRQFRANNAVTAGTLAAVPHRQLHAANPPSSSSAYGCSQTPRGSRSCRPTSGTPAPTPAATAAADTGIYAGFAVNLFSGGRGASRLLLIGTCG